MITRNTLARLATRLAPFAFAALVLTPAAQALDQDRLKKLFGLLDRDGNGQVTRPEYETGLGLVFYTLDANADLVLTDDEINLTPDAFRHVAGDDGKIEGLEFFTADIATFESIDEDDDLIVTFPELLGYVEKYAG